MNDRPRPQILIVDSHPLTRRGMADFVYHELGYEVRGAVPRLSDARAVMAESEPDLLVCELEFPNDDALQFIQETRAQYPSVQVLVVSSMNELIYARRSLDAGASGYVHKSASPDVLGEAFAEALAGNLWVSREVTRYLLGRVLQPVGQQAANGNGSACEVVSSLSNRELQVFRMAGDGLKTGEIAAALGISPRTVESHKEHIKEKLGLGTAAELAAQATLWLGR